VCFLPKSSRRTSLPIVNVEWGSSRFSFYTEGGIFSQVMRFNDFRDFATNKFKAMKNKVLIGRLAEKKILENALVSDKAEMANRFWVWWM
jgi:hypothetical protein